MHGAAFATFAGLPKSKFRYLSGESELQTISPRNPVLIGSDMLLICIIQSIMHIINKVYFRITFAN